MAHFRKRSHMLGKYVTRVYCDMQKIRSANVWHNIPAAKAEHDYRPLW